MDEGSDLFGLEIERSVAKSRSRKVDNEVER